MRKSVTLQVRMSDDLRGKIDKAALAMSLKASEWARLTLACAVRRMELSEIESDSIKPTAPSARKPERN